MAIAKVTIFLLFVAFSQANPKPKGFKYGGSTMGKFKWMVSLGYQDQESNSWNHLCEGSILSNRTIATSGDCVELFNEDMIIKDVETKNVKTKDVETMDVETKDVETKLQIRVGDEEFEDDDDDDNVKVYFADGFRKHDSNVALIATNEFITFNDRVGQLALPEEDEYVQNKAANLAMWNDDGELEEDDRVKRFMYGKDIHHYDNPLKTCRGFGASMVMAMEPAILIGILGKDPNCENEAVKDDGKFKRKFAKVAHPEVLKFIKDSKKDLELCQSLKDCFCELRDLRC